jgi:hypothetical protein
MTDYAYPINIFPWHGTRLRDKENVFLSLIQRGNLNDARKTGAFWQNALREAIWMQGYRSSLLRNLHKQ